MNIVPYRLPMRKCAATFCWRVEGVAAHFAVNVNKSYISYFELQQCLWLICVLAFRWWHKNVGKGCVISQAFRKYRDRTLSRIVRRWKSFRPTQQNKVVHEKYTYLLKVVLNTQTFSINPHKNSKLTDLIEHFSSPMHELKSQIRS